MAQMYYIVTVCSSDHPQIVMELPVEHGLLLDNLLDLAHAPFTHTSTFAKGWSVPRYYIPCISLVKTDWRIYTFITMVILFVQINMLILCYFCQFGEVLNACIWAPRVLGSLPDRHGVPTTVHGPVDHWHLKAWKARREEHPAMFYTSPPTPCLLALL